MPPPIRQSGLLRSALLLFAVLSGAAAGAEGHWRGRSIADVLRALQSERLRILYSSELLPEDRRVAADPAARDPVGIATEILAPLGLALRHLEGPQYAVVRRGAAATATDQEPRRHSVAALDEVVVTASHYTLVQASAVTLQRLDGATLEQQPGTAQDTLRALQHLPGFANDGISAAANVRGSAAADTLVLLDGFPLRQSYHIPGYLSPFGILDESLVSRVDVYTGGFAVRYGNRTGAVIDARTIDARDEPRRALGLNVLNAYGRAGGLAAAGAVDWLAGARLGMLRPLLASVATDFGRPDYSDAYLRFQYRPNGRWELSGNLLWATDEFFLSQDDERARLDGRTRYLWLHARADLGGERAAEFWLGHSRLVSERRGDDAKPDLISGSLHDERAAHIFDGRGLLHWRWSARSASEAGIEWSATRAHLRYASDVVLAPATAQLFMRPESAAFAVAAAPRTTYTAVFADYRAQFASRLAGEFGLRAEHRPQADTRWSADPRVGLSLRLDRRSQLRLHWGRAHQSEDPSQWLLEDGVVPARVVTAADSTVLALDRGFGGGISLRLEAYHKRISHPAVQFENLLHSISPIPELSPDRVRVAARSATVSGAELVFSLERERWNLWSSLAMARACDRIDGASVPRSWDQRYAWTTRAEARRGSWRVAASLELRDGWPTTRLLRQGDGPLVLGERNATRLPDLAVLGVRVEYRRALPLGSLAVALDVHNLTNRSNAYGSEVEVLPDADGSPALASSPLVALPIIPSLGVKWEF